ncbi:MAG TPA: hypothetical protein VGD60_09800 [Candidatus Acidoferrales bacterium]
MHADSNDWSELDRALKEFSASGVIEVREDGKWLSELSGLSWEVHHETPRPLIHLSSEEGNLTRQLLRVKEVTPNSIVIEVQRFGKSKPGRLEFVRRDDARTPQRVTREQFRERFERILAEKFPDSIVDSLTSSPDLQHSFSGLYVRGTMHEGNRAWALLAAGPRETDTVERMLVFGILWLDWCRNHSAKRAVEGLRLFVPEGSSRSLRERALGLSNSVKMEIFEMREPDVLMQRVDPADGGNLESYLVSRHEIESTTAVANDAAQRLRALLLNENEKFTTRVQAAAGVVSFCFRGVEFARRTREGIFFGLGKSVEKLNDASEPRLRKLLRDLCLYRNPLASDTKHKLYRGWPERWLESIVLEEPAKLDAILDPRHFYSQVPALAAGDRAVPDLLGITRQGRLVVIELKASEDIQLPMQAVDYWLRVRRHQRADDFHRQGYFAGVEIDPRPPLLWLVAPVLHFHSATEIILKYLSPEIHATRIGLQENWRRGIKVMLRQ